jgi:hypothetical protein
MKWNNRSANEAISWLMTLASGTILMAFRTAIAVRAGFIEQEKNEL